jgi:lipid-binding SYLF domain-containing protein
LSGASTRQAATTLRHGWKERGTSSPALTQSGHDIRAEQLDRADCIAVIPGLKKGAVVAGVGYGRGFVSCRNGGAWSAPAGISLESGSLGVRIGGEKMDPVILSLDSERRTKLLSDRFAIGSDASAAWGNGKSAHDDPNAKILFYGGTKGAFAGFGLDGATLKPDQSGTQALYGRSVTNSAVVDGSTSTPDDAGEGLCGNIWTSSGTQACLLCKPPDARLFLPLNGKCSCGKQKWQGGSHCRLFYVPAWLWASFLQFTPSPR